MSVHKQTSSQQFSIYPKQSLTKLSTQFISSTVLAISVFICYPAHSESNVAGEEITIAPDETLKPVIKDLGIVDNVVPKKSNGYRLSNSLETQVQEDANIQPEFINIGSEDLWQRIKDGYAMPDSTSSLVANHENWYSSRPDYIRRMVERSQKYLFHIVEEVEKRGMPTEIALLPMIESAYNPQAYSTSNASGIWQFITSTGKHFGLKQNWWIDNRRNVVIATDAALTYLQKLYGMFGSWDLALAAYNAGEGTVGRAIERNRRLGLATDYESLNLPSETKNYVPKLQAIKNLMTNPGKYGLKIQTIANTAYFTKVSAPLQIDAHLAAKLAEISDDEFLALNPSNKRPVISNNGEKHEILLPILAAQTFRDNLANYNKPLVSWQTYFAKRGERMEKIASKFGIQLSKLRNINNLPSQNKIKKSSTILVPNGNKTDFSGQKSLSSNTLDVVQDAETSHQISAQQASDNINLAEMDAANYEKTSEYNKDKSEPVATLNIKHKVKKGETLHAIAKHYGVSVEQIVESSTLKNKKVKIGQLLTINKASDGQDDTKLTDKKDKKKAQKNTTNKKIKSKPSKKKRH